MKCFICGEEYDPSNKVVAFTWEGEKVYHICIGSKKLRVCPKCLKAFTVGVCHGRGYNRYPDGVKVEYEEET